MPKNAPAPAIFAALAALALGVAGCAATDDQPSAASASVSLASSASPSVSASSSPTASISNGAPTGLNDDPEVDDDTMKIFGKYVVDGDDLEGDVPEEYAEVWDRFAELVPADMRPEVTLFVPIDGDASGGTDGAMQINGLYPDERYIALDVTGFSEGSYLDRTMLHEFAHLLTLRDSQLDQDEDDIDTCPVYSDPLCPEDDSYLFPFLTEYWPDVQGYEFNESEEATEERYDEDVFVSDYAPKNPDEDIAEVFAEWMTATEPTTGDRIVDEKMRFFDDYPELVAYREYVAPLL